MKLSSFGERLAKLRIAKGVSAREMSLDIGRNENYINKIENSKIFPAIPRFFEICEYLGISQIDFFDEDDIDPIMTKEMQTHYLQLDHNARKNLIGVVKTMAENTRGRK